MALTAPEAILAAGVLRPGARLFVPPEGWDGTAAGLGGWGGAEPPTDEELEAKHAELKVADAALRADRDQLRAEFQAAQARLDEIVGYGATITAAQSREAVVDLARIQRRMLRVVRGMAGES